MVQEDKQGNKITLYPESNEIAITPKNGSTLFYTIKEIIKCLNKERPKMVLKPEGPEANYYYSQSCPHCKKELKCNMLGYSYVQAVGKTKYCPNCGGKLKWRK